MVHGHPLLALGLLAIACIGQGAYASNHWAITQTLAGPAMAGRWSSLQNGVANFSGIAAPWLTGLIVQTRGSARLAFTVTGVVALIGGLIVGIAGAARGAGEVGSRSARTRRRRRRGPDSSGGGARFELADGFEHFGEGGFADLALEFLLHAVECGDDAQGAALALRLEREQVGARVPGIDFALQKPLGFKRRDAMAEVAARGGRRSRPVATA